METVFFSKLSLPVSGLTARPHGCRTSRAFQMRSRKAACPSSLLQISDIPLSSRTAFHGFFFLPMLPAFYRDSLEVVILDRMVKDGAELIVDGFEIYGERGLPFVLCSSSARFAK